MSCLAELFMHLSMNECNAPHSDFDVQSLLMSNVDFVISHVKARIKEIESCHVYDTAEFQKVHSEWLSVLSLVTYIGFYVENTEFCDVCSTFLQLFGDMQTKLDMQLRAYEYECAFEEDETMIEDERADVCVIKEENVYVVIKSSGDHVEASVEGLHLKLNRHFSVR